MANLDIIIGPMFAGKSCELIKRIRLLKVLHKQYIVVKPIIDTRYENNIPIIISHNYDSENCIKLSRLSDIFNTVDITHIENIFIDEGQFFEDLKQTVLILVEKHNINVTITGLDGDSNRSKFGQILDLIPYSTTTTKINALCVKCLDGTHAPFTHRMQNNTNTRDQVLIGDGDIYMSVCRKHYLELNTQT